MNSSDPEPPSTSHADDTESAAPRLLLLADDSETLHGLTTALQRGGYSVGTEHATAAPTEFNNRYAVVVLQWKPKDADRLVRLVDRLRRSTSAGVVLVSDEPALTPQQVRDAVASTAPVACVEMINPAAVLSACRIAEHVTWARRSPLDLPHTLSAMPALKRRRFIETTAALLQRRGNLSARMTQALELKLLGLDPEDAAKEMSISPNTYRNHIQSALRRLHADGFDELWRIVGDIVDTHTGLDDPPID